jgi:hypothetical protein
VWPENYSVNSTQKVWGAVFAAHHPNVVVLDLSSFKCGHDSPVYGLVDAIIETSKTPYAALHDLDANKPAGSIKIRVKTYAHALKLHEERLRDARMKREELVPASDKKRLELLELRQKQLADRRVQDTHLKEQIEAIREKVRSYAPPARTADPEQMSPEQRGIMKLGRRAKDGSIVRLDAKASTSTSNTAP